MATEFNHEPLLAFQIKEKEEEGWTVIPPRIRDKPVHAFWDWDNLKLPVGYGITKLWENVEKGLKNYDPSLVLSSFTASGDFFTLAHNEEASSRKAIARQRLFDLDNNRYRTFKTPVRVRTCQVCLQQFPNLSQLSTHQRRLHDRFNYQDEYSRVMDVGDAFLARQMKFLHFTHPPPAVVLCLSEDGDFGKSLDYMARRGYKVLLAESEQRESENPYRPTPLRAYPNAIWYWEKLIVGEGPFKTQDCGGCFTVLRAKIKERQADSVSEKAVEDRAKPVSVKAIVDSSETSSDSDVPSISASLRHQQNVPVAVEGDPCSKPKPSADAVNSSVLGDKDDPKSQSGRQEPGLDRFRKRTTKRCDSEGVINRLSTSRYPPCDEGTSSSAATNYLPDSLHEFQKRLKDESDEAIEQDRAGLLRQLDKLKEQLVQSCNVAGEKPKEQSSSSTGLNKAPPVRFYSSGNHAVAGPSYYHQHPEPQFSYNNNNNSNEVSMHHSLMHPSYGDPHRFQMHGRGPPPLQPSHPYFSGQYVGNNNINGGHDLFDAYPQQNGHFHHSACSCYHCYDNKYWRGSAPDAPYNAGFYPHESVMGFAPPHNPRTYASSRGLTPHGRWPSNFSEAQMEAPSRVRPPPKVVLSGGSRHIRPLGGGAPFITCQNCFELLQLPKKPEAGAKKQQKVRCGACSCLMDVSVVNNKFVLSTNTASTRQGEARVAADYTSDDYDLLGYVFHSLDDEPRDFATAPGLISDKSQDLQNVHSHSASLSEEDELSSDSLTAKPLAQAQDSPLHENFVDYASINHDRSGAGSRSSRSEKDRVTLSKTMRQNSMKEVSLASEMEVSFNDYSHHNSGVSKDQQQRSKKNGFASIVKKSFKDLTKSIQNDEGNKSNVSINGHPLTERLLRKAEKQAGAIQPGNYWYDYRAGFWGVMGGPGLGIIPPFIEELNYPMPENCAGGTTGVFVNGRELHRKDLDLLAGRGLPPDRDRSYVVDITGRVIDEDTGEELDCLGKLAPTIEKLKRGFGMRFPKRAT